MRTLKSLAYLYVLLCTVVLVALFGLLWFADTARFAQHWVNETVATLLDILKVIVGAAVGSISAAFVMAIDKEKKSER